MLEAGIEQKTRRWFKAQGCLYLKLLPTVVGIPDRLVLGPARLAFFIETKRPNKEPTKIQLYIHRKLREYGFNVYVCTSLEQAQAAYQEESARC